MAIPFRQQMVLQTQNTDRHIQTALADTFYNVRNRTNDSHLRSKNINWTSTSPLNEMVALQSLYIFTYDYC
jgi:hypothetical protein